MIMDLKEEARGHLQQKLIPFWEGLADERFGGYCGYVGFDLRPDVSAPKGCILNSRILWFFSRAAQALKEERLLAYARRAYDFYPHFVDGDNGGLFWSVTYDGQPLDTMKHTYVHAFAIYGLVAYAEASGDREALERAMALYTLIETRMRDGHGYLEAFSREFEPLENAKLSDNPKLLARGVIARRTMNTILHLVEAYTQLYRVGRDDRVRNSLQNLLWVVENRVYNRERNRLEVFFDDDLNSIFDMQSYGHDIEASWLIDLAAQTALSPEDCARVRGWTTELARGVIDRAFQGGRLLNENTEGENDPTCIWWVQAETMVGLANLWQKTGDLRWKMDMEEAWRFITTRLVDPREGSEWFWSLAGDGTVCEKPIVEPWKCPYHNGRMCMELMARL